jgi:signal transduction histidine kinase
MSGGDNASNGKNFLYRVKHALRLKISAKILIYFLLIALVPLLVVSYVLVTAANDQLLKNASTKQQAVAVDLSRRVDNYLANNVNSLAYVARLYSSRNLDAKQMDQSLIALFSQNAALKKITLLKANGASGSQRTLTLQDNGSIAFGNETIDTSPEIFNFIAGKAYLVSVGRDEKNTPKITVGIPILKKYGPATNDLFATQASSTDNIIGAIAGDYSVGDLWESVLSAKIGTGGYAYVVTGEGALVAHPDRKFINSHRDLVNTQAVSQFRSNNTDTRQTVSETNQDVISTPHKTSTGWAVVVEEPVSSIYASINSFIQLAATVGIIAIILSVGAGIFFSRQFIRPIRQLSLGARRMEKGEFDQKIDVGTKDELQELADTFNGMAQGINKLISDLQTNNLKLKIEQIKLNNIISSVSDGVVAVNAKGQIISINPPAALLIGQDPKSLEGKLISEEFTWEHEGVRFTPDLVNGGIYRYSDLTMNRGDSLAYLDLMVAVLDHSNSDIAAIITIHDQTASRELSFMKLDFVAIAAHELRTPLTVVRGYLDMLNTGTAVKELSIFNLENLSKAIDGADQLRQLINKLLNIARIERGDMEIFIEKLNLSKLVHDNVDQHLSMAAQKEQTISYNASTNSTVYVPADPASIVEVVNNLIGNAIKYTGKGGKVKVNLIVNKDDVRVEVTDNGPGIPEELRAKLFTKFYRAERSLIAGTRGTGLGLFISKTIIELQKGKIGIEPDKGSGSTFYFTLPIYDPVRDDEQIAKKTSGGIRGWFKKHPSS